MKLTLNQAQSALIIGAAKPGERPILGNICLRNKELVVADGFMLISTPTDVEGEAVIPAEAIRNIRNGDLKVEVDGEQVTVTASQKLSDDKYPDFKDITTFKTAPIGYIAINAEYLSRLCELAKGTNHIVHLYIRAPNTPVEFTIGVDEYHGLIMPMWTNPDKSKLYPIVP